MYTQQSPCNKQQSTMIKASSNIQQLIASTVTPVAINSYTIQQQQQCNNQPPSMEFSTCKTMINDCREVLSNNAMCEVSSLLLLHVFIHLNGRIFT